MDKAEAISRAAAAEAAAENCCAREKAKKGRKISIGFSIFFSLFVFVLFGVDEREVGGEPAGRRTLLEFHCCVCFVAATGNGREGGGECACVLRRRLARIFD